MVAKNTIRWFVKNFTLGFIVYGIITPAINKEMKGFSNNLILARELLIKLPFSTESKISKLVLANLQMEQLISFMELLQKRTAANKQANNFYRGVF